jgi:hypothetical protein
MVHLLTVQAIWYSSRGLERALASCLPRGPKDVPPRHGFQLPRSLGAPAGGQDVSGKWRHCVQQEVSSALIELFSFPPSSGVPTGDHSVPAGRDLEREPDESAWQMYGGRSQAIARGAGQ